MGIIPEIFIKECRNDAIVKNFNLSHKLKLQIDKQEKEEGHQIENDSDNDQVDDAMGGIIQKFCDSEAFSSMLVIKRDGTFYKNWNRGISYLSILSSFLFAGCAAFTHLTYDKDWRLYTCEVLFAIDLIFKFFLDL